MPRIARQESPSSIYHVMNRGAGKQIIFEDDADKSFFVRKLAALLREHNADLLAWCLMDNHYHLLLRIEHDSLATIMHRLQTSYAGYFNRVHEHSGALFGSRFLSEPVDSDEYLLTVVVGSTTYEITVKDAASYTVSLNNNTDTDIILAD